MANQFTQEQQTSIVKMARDLTAAIQYEEEELAELTHAKFKNVPTPPKHEQVKKEEAIQPVYPVDPTPEYTYIQHIQNMVHISNQTLFWVIFALLVVTFAGGLAIFLIVAYFSYRKERKAKIEELKHTDEYMKLVNEAERIAAEKNAEIEKKHNEAQKLCDEKYEKEKAHYDSVILPQYNEEKALWEKNQNRKIAVLKEEIALNKEALEILYEKTKMVSVTYRELWILTWLFDDMNSSDHDIRYATELLDRDRQRLATEDSGRLIQTAIGNMENSMIHGMKSIFDSIEYGNSLQEESIAQLSKVRRDTNIGNLIGTVQHHNTNKMLEQMLKK